MSARAQNLSERYARALTAFLTRSDDDALEEAYELGREAISEGLGVLDLAAIHGEACGRAVPQWLATFPELTAAPLRGPWHFFAESLGPFEMALRGFKETNAALTALTGTLEERVSARTADLESAERSLREQTRILSSVVGSISDGIAVANAAGRFILFNDAGRRIVGAESTADPPSRGPTVLGCFRPDQKTPFPSEELPLVRAMKGEQTAAIPMFLRNEQIPDGLHLSVIGSPLRGEDRRVEGGVVVFRDVTEARRADDEREQTREALRKTEEQVLQLQKMDAVGRLAGGIAHDFNNLLSVILSYAEMIQRRLKPDAPLYSDIEEIRSAGTRAAGLTRQLLAFSRQQVLEARLLSLNESTTAMQTMLARLLGADITLTLLLAAQPWTVKADPSQVEQILLNLSVNARDAMPQGGQLTIETGNVDLDADYALSHPGVTPGPYAMLAVSDTGTGMSSETQRRLFEPFFTTKEKGKGTGLGLATVFGIVKQSGGHVWVYSEIGKGTTFKIYLPKVSGVAEGQSIPAPGTPDERGHETILLVEDDDQVRAIARSVLRRQGYVVLEASNAGEALLTCEQHAANIDLLLTDVVMPRMSGRELAERLAPMRPRMKVLFMSGYTDDAVLQHGVLDSGAAYLQKPFTPTSLARKVGEVVRTQKVDELGSIGDPMHPKA